MKTTFIAFICLLFFFTLTATKCNKEDPPKATVTVLDENNNPLAGAQVKVYSDPTYYIHSADYQPVGYYNPDEKQLYDIQYTDGSGQTRHSFKYESIYSVKVTYIKSIAHPGTHNADTTFLYGQGALVLKNNKTYSETIYCY